MFRSGPVVQLKEASERLAEVAAMDLTALTEGEVVELVLVTQRAAAIARAVHTAAVARLDVTKAFEADGARSAASWVAWRCGTSGAEAHATARCGRELRSMPATEAAFLDGLLTTDHVRLLARAQRRAHCSETFEAMVAVDPMLDAVGGAIYGGELRRLEQQLFDEDWAEARGRLGDAALPADLCRTPAQRRADAMVEMARRSAAKDAGAKDARPLLTVLLGEKTLDRICELSNGTVVTPGEVLPLLCEADVERVVFDGPSRVLDVGVRKRLFTGATRRAVEVRDRRCVHPSCDVPADQTQIDHVEPYEDGGLTVQDNGVCRCPFHHRLRHRRGSPPS